MRRFASLVLALSSSVALAGCPENSPAADAAAVADAGRDAPVPPSEDAFVTPGTDAFVTPSEDAFVTPSDDAFVAPDAVVVPRTWTEVHTALETSCTPCHVTIGSGGHNMAQSDEAAAYSDSQLAASACAGVTKGACAAMRVRAGTMPPGGLAEPMRSELAALLDGWVAAGQPAP
ncbi:MAG: hypothetical protein K1X94_18895 [Sandaracinaceae bacterium]|nr:hypothetical protein [Sandaracinaceae bacterium]